MWLCKKCKTEVFVYEYSELIRKYSVDNFKFKTGLSIIAGEKIDDVYWKCDTCGINTEFMPEEDKEIETIAEWSD